MSRPTCDTPGCGRKIPVGGEGHPEICPKCLRDLDAKDRAQSMTQDSETPPMASDSPTLLSDLLMAADVACEYAAVSSGMKKSYLDPVPETPFAARLRAAHARLRKEMERARRDDIDGEFNAAAPWYLKRLELVNGGPLEPTP